MTRKQELTVRTVIMILTAISVFYGLSFGYGFDGNFMFWSLVMPTFLIGGLVFFSRRRSRRIETIYDHEDMLPGSDPVVNSLERLAKLYREGALSKNEFESEKRRMLNPSSKNAC